MAHSRGGWQYSRLLSLALGALVFGLVHGQPVPVRAWVVTPVCEIQGAGFTSPYVNMPVQVQGVVTADLDETARRGFYLQQPDCDTDPTTSDGVFVYLGERTDVVQVGDRALVSGIVQEYYGLTEIKTSPANVQVVAQQQALPAAADLSPPFDDQQALAYYERLEGMLVRLARGRVVGPTGADGNTWLLDAGWGTRRVFAAVPEGSGAVVCAGRAGLFAIAPDVFYGQFVAGLEGALAYSYGEYCLDLTHAPQVEPAGPPGVAPLTPDGPGLLRFATFNLHNLFDALDDPLTQDTILSANEYQLRLEKRALAIVQLGFPSLVAVQEVENLTTLQDLASRPELSGVYQALLVDGPDRRGLDVGFLYRPDRLALQSWSALQGCTPLVDGLGPDGNLDVEHPANAVTCDTDGDGMLDGNRLFSRPPLLAHFQTHSQPPASFWVVANHWKSKTEDTPSTPYTLARRTEQARFIAGFAEKSIGLNPPATWIILGDLNDWPGSQPLATLEAAGWLQTWRRLPDEQRYSYIYRGRSQALDHILVKSPALAGTDPAWMSREPAVLPINADFPASWSTLDASAWRSSDHDPYSIPFTPVLERLYLPVFVR